MILLNPGLRDVALARVQALNTLDENSPGAVRLVANDMGLSRSSVLRWPRRKLGGDLDDTDGVPTRVLGADPIRIAPLYPLRQYEVAGGNSADEYSEAPQLLPTAEGKYMSSLVALQGTDAVKEDYTTGHIRQCLARIEGTAVSHRTVAHGLAAALWALRRDRKPHYG